MRSKGYAAIVLSAVAAGLVMPASALAVKPTVTTGGASNVTFQSARLNGRVDANNQATTYYFQYGTTIALGSNTAVGPAGGGNRAFRRIADIGGLAPLTRYYYRIVASNNSGTTLGKRRSFTTRRQPLGVSLSATPNPVKATSSATTLFGNLTGTNNAGRKVVLQASAWPFTAGFQNVTNEQVTNATGGFSFPILSVAANTQYRVQMPERPQIVSPIVTLGVKPYVRSKVNKKRVRRGKRIRFRGSVKPASTGSQQQIAIQKWNGDEWVTVGGTVVRDSGRFSKRQRIRRGGRYRVWTGSTTGQYASNVGKTFKIRSFR
jgi:hypothetical protein